MKRIFVSRRLWIHRLEFCSAGTGKLPNNLAITNLDALTYAGNPDNLADLATHPRIALSKEQVADGPFVLASCRRV